MCLWKDLQPDRFTNVTPQRLASGRITSKHTAIIQYNVGTASQTMVHHLTSIVFMSYICWMMSKRGARYHILIVRKLTLFSRGDKCCYYLDNSSTRIMVVYMRILYRECNSYNILRILHAEIIWLVVIVC